MTIERARREFPTWAATEALPKPAARKVDDMLHTAIKKYGIAILVLVAFAMYGWMISVITEHNTRIEVRAQLEEEYEQKLEAYKAEQKAAAQAEYFLSGDASREAALNQEADAIARAIGPMKTKRMKQTMIWNILTRVDNPAYPGSIKEVIEQPQQWMFYSESNPIREDDRQLALEQLQLWHEGRYPAGLSTDYVYGEWSENDYVLRNAWEKNSRTGYWRMPE